MTTRRRYTVSLSARQLDAIDSALAGYEPDPCHDHPHRGPCTFGWSPRDMMALWSATDAIARAVRRIERPA